MTEPVRPRAWRHHAVVLLVAVLMTGAVLAAAQTWLVRVYVVEGTSMQPSVEPGDHVLTDLVGPVQRGDVVVVALDGTPSVKRVIGVPGDHVWCCARGTHAVVVDDGELAEPYLYPGDRPSTLAFDVVVPEDAFWVMGDHRSASQDSRSVSTVPASSVIGVARKTWTPASFGAERTGPLTGRARATNGATLPNRTICPGCHEGADSRTTTPSAPAR